MEPSIDEKLKACIQKIGSLNRKKGIIFKNDNMNERGVAYECI